MGDRTKLQRKMFAGELIDMVNPNGHSRPSGSHFFADMGSLYSIIMTVRKSELRQKKEGKGKPPWHVAWLAVKVGLHSRETDAVEYYSTFGLVGLGKLKRIPSLSADWIQLKSILVSVSRFRGKNSAHLTTKGLTCGQFLVDQVLGYGRDLSSFWKRCERSQLINHYNKWRNMNG